MTSKNENKKFKTWKSILIQNKKPKKTRENTRNKDKRMHRKYDQIQAEHQRENWRKIHVKWY